MKISAHQTETAALLTPAEAARALRVTPRTIYLWINAGKLDVVRVSDRVTRIPHEEIERLLGQRERGASTPPLGKATRPDLASVLWDVDLARLDEEVHARLIIERVLEAGRPDQVRWLFSRYPIEHVLEVAESSRVLSRRASVAWSTLIRERVNRAA